MARRLGGLAARSALAFLLLVVSCVSASRSDPGLVAELVRSDIQIGMTKAEVVSVLGEPERRKWAEPSFMNIQNVAGNNRPRECWFWGGSGVCGLATVCFSGMTRKVSYKSP